MARALSDDLRERALEAGTARASTRSIAARFGVGISTAIRWLHWERESGERRVVRVTARLQSECIVEIGHSMLSRWLRQHGWTFKKRLPMHWSRSAKTS